MKSVFLHPALAVILMASSDPSAAGPDAAAINSAIAAVVTPAPLDDPIVAKGKGFEIRRSAVDQVLATAKAQESETGLPPDAELHAITNLIEIQLVLQKATAAEKNAGGKTADETLAALSKTLSAPEFERRLKATHMTVDELRLKLAEEATAQASLTRQLGIVVTDADAKQFFDDHPEAYDQPVIARVREIMLLTTSDFSTSAAPPLPVATIQAKHKLVNELLQRLRAGGDFAALAKQYNEDPLSKDTDGELSFSKDQMEFSDLAFSMKTNQISDVITNEDGYRIFQLLEIIPAKKAGFTALADRLKNMLIGKQKRMLAPPYIKQLKKEADVKILDAKLREALTAAEAETAEAGNPRAATTDK
jgi:parvulin-like peptidyl-prolyl isomerase